MELEGSKEAIEQGFIPLEEYGCYVGVINGKLHCIDMLINGEPDTEESDGKLAIGEVEEPHDHGQVYLDEVNVLFGTNFQMHQFDYPECTLTNCIVMRRLEGAL
jgi:hypothetical protein